MLVLGQGNLPWINLRSTNSWIDVSLMGRVYGNRGYRSRVMYSARYHCRMLGARFLGSNYQFRCVDSEHYHGF